MLAQALAGEVVFNHRSDEWIADILAQQMFQGVFPAEALSSLRSALDHRSMSNRSGAIASLAQLPANHPHWAAVTDDLAYQLGRHEHQNTRSAAAMALGKLGASKILPQTAQAALELAAAGDDYITVRMDALEALLPQSSQRGKSSRGNKVLISELLNPSDDLWRRSSGLRQHSGIKDRALGYLAAWYAPDYPPDVVSIFINECKGRSPDRALGILRDMRLRDDLSNESLRELKAIAENHKQTKVRKALYEIALPNLVQGSLVDARRAMANSPSAGGRLEAAHSLLRHYSETSVPLDVSDLANKQMQNSAEQPLRLAAAQLVAQGDEPLASREEKILTAINRHKRDTELQEVLLGLYDPKSLDEFAERHAADGGVDKYFRAKFIRQLSENTQQPMSTKLQEALKLAAKESSDYFLVGAIHKSLETRSAGVPLIVKLKLKSNQRQILSALWYLCVLVNAAAAATWAIGIATAPLQPTARKTKRGLLWLIWIVAGIGMLVLLALGFLGFVGHNSPPAPRHSLTANAPLFMATVIYAFVAVRRLLRSKRQSTLG